MSSPTFNTALAAPDLAALKKEELDGLASKLRYAIKLRETETEAPDGYYTFTAGLSTLLMGLFERHTKKLGEQERSNPNGEAAPQESRNKPWMDDLLGELLAISREETTRAMQVISQKDEELRSVKEELKKVKLEALLTIGEYPRRVTKVMNCLKRYQMICALRRRRKYVKYVKRSTRI